MQLRLSISFLEIGGKRGCFTFFHVEKLTLSKPVICIAHLLPSPFFWHIFLMNLNLITFYDLEEGYFFT